ncbi:MAG: hypothetical protein ACKPKO_38500 [Candidatus Fonsibacter sp.]
MYARTHGRGQASAMNIAAEYAKERMAKGREVISRSLIDTALTIHGRVLGISTVERLPLDMDNLPRTDNPCNSVQRLQDIVSNRGNNKALITWLLERISHMVCVPVVAKLDSIEFYGRRVARHRGLDVIWLTK